MRKVIVAAITGLWLASAAGAQGPSWRFDWKKGQELRYRVEHTTTVSETIGKTTEKTSSKLNLLKLWKVLDVSDGVATLQLTLLFMRNEQTRPNGEVLLFDSEQLDKSTPLLKEHMAKFIRTPLAELKVDASGKVLEAKQDAQRYEAELPFQLIVPVGPATPNQSWERTFAVVLNPPHGTGERYQAVQQYQCKEMNQHYARVALKTSIKDLPASPLDQVPLLQKMPEGEVIFNLQSGRLHGAYLRIVRDLEDHQGKGSRYHFESNYREEYVAE